MTATAVTLFLIEGLQLYRKLTPRHVERGDESGEQRILKKNI